MIVLGLNVFHADTAACLVIDGRIIAACEEERFTRIKHFTGFPYNSINYCLRKHNITLDQVDFITVNYNLKYNFKHRLGFLFKNISASNLLRKLSNLWSKKSLSNLIIDYFGTNCEKKIVYIPHHISHVASSYFTSGFDDAVGLSIDGTGDFSSMEISYCKGKKINVLQKNLYPHSMGILYQAITQFLGFKKYGDEYKIMALAAYGKPRFKKEFENLVKFVLPYNFELNMKYFVHNRKFDFKESLSDEPIFENLFSKELEKLLGKSRDINEDIKQVHFDIAASLQRRFEEIILKIIENLHLEGKSDNLCLSGGCIFNSVLNGKIIEQNKFKNIHIHSNVGDAGGAVGSALYLTSTKFKNKKFQQFDNNFLGPKYSTEEIGNFIDKNKKILSAYNIEKFNHFDDVIKRTVEVLANGKIVGWFQDEAEWGPRALGNRSILMNAEIKEAKEMLNSKIKLREQFRPFAVSILEEEVKDYFHTNESYYPNMNFVFKAKEKTVEKFPSIVHEDGSSRIQSVSEKSNQKFYWLIKEFRKKTNNPLLLNTSLNISEPICESPEHVFKSFYGTNIDCLVLQDYVLIKN